MRLALIFIASVALAQNTNTVTLIPDAAGTNVGKIRMLELRSNGANALTLKGPASIASDRSVTFPDASMTVSGIDNPETITGLKTFSTSPKFTSGDAAYIQRSSVTSNGQIIWTVNGLENVQGAGAFGMAFSPINASREAFRLGIRDASSLKYPLYVVSDEVYTNAHVSPLADDTYDLGAPSYRWHKLWVKDLDISGGTNLVTLNTDQTVAGQKIFSRPTNQSIWIQGAQNGIRYYGQDGSSNYTSIYSANGDLNFFNSACCVVATVSASQFRVNTQLAPGTDGAYYLGDPAKYWHTIWANNIEAAPAGASNNYIKTRKLAWVDNGGGGAYWDAMALASSVSSNWILRDPAGNNMIAAYRKVASSDVAYADVALDWRPSGTRTLGASGARWSTAYMDVLDVGTSVQSNLIPTSSYTWDLGSSTNKWQNVYGNIFRVDSAILPSAAGVNLGSAISHFSLAWIDGLTASAISVGSLSVGSCSGCMGGTVSSNLMPGANLSYDLGGASNQWLNSYISLLRISNAILPNGVGINLGSAISRFDAYLNNLSLYTGVQRAPNGLAGVTVTTPCAVISGGIVTSFSCVN